jgi:hypothetical protein
LIAMEGGKIRVVNPGALEKIARWNYVR